MKIFFTGAAPWVDSGYGKPLRYLIPRLAALGHELAIGCFYGWQGSVTKTTVGDAEVTLYPTARDRYFNDMIEFHVAAFGAQVVITLQDAWILKGWGKRGFTWLPWLPVDCSPVTTPEHESLEGCYAPLSYSKWGRDRLIEAGWPSARYVPFGVDLDVHKPADKRISRQRAGLPLDGFIAGMVAANSSSPSRKSFPEVLQAWAGYKAGGGEGRLYLHTTLAPTREHGVDLPRICNTLNLDFSPLDNPDRDMVERASVLFPSQHRLWLSGFTDSDLAALYNSFNVLLAPSMGEGFGIPIIEAQACGVPVITNAATSMPELTFSGMCLEPAQMTWIDKGGWRAAASVERLTEALHWAGDVLMTPGGQEHHAQRAVNGVEHYDWDNVVKTYWEPLLEELADVG